jgi:hypothetical protein
MSESPNAQRPALAGVRLDWGVRIPLRDGTRLSASLYSPRECSAPLPCIFALTPYTVHRNHFRASYFAARGWRFLVVDARGRGNSDGVFRPFIQEASDGFDIVEWIASQPFCNGQVAMFGGSYVGYAQWATAKGAPPHLSTIVPAAAAAPGVQGNPMRNNIAHPYFMRWLTSVAGRTHQQRIFEDQAFWRDQFRDWYESGRPFRELDRRVGYPSSTFQEWVAHPAQDAYWDALRPTREEYARIDLPILTLTGAYDADQLGALHYYREHLRAASTQAAAKHYLVIGPWNHLGTLEPTPRIGGLEFGAAALLDVLQLQAEWYDWTLRNGPQPGFLQQRVTYYVAGLESWRRADTLEAVTAHVEPLYLDSDGSASSLTAAGQLQRSMGSGPADSYVYDPRDLHIARVEAQLADPYTILRPTFPIDDPTDPALLHANKGRALFYDTAPFVRAAELSGFFRLSVWIAIDQPDTDFSVTLYEVSADGKTLLLTSDLLRARYRESLRQGQLVRTSEPLCYEFDRFTFTSRRVCAGSRLRLVLGPVNSIHSQRNFNSGGVVAEESIADARACRVRVFHDRSHPSVLYVPFGQAESQDAANALEK